MKLGQKNIRTLFLERLGNIKPLIYRGCLKEVADKLNCPVTRIYNVINIPIMDWKVLQAIENHIIEKNDEIEKNAPKNFVNV